MVFSEAPVPGTTIGGPATAPPIDVESTAASDPEGINRAIAGALAPPEVPIPEIADTHLTLPGGLIVEGQCLDQAEIRELNGQDEEALARLGDNVTTAKRYSVLLQRCLVSLNGRKLHPAEVDSFILGDRDELLLAIRMATFGKEVELKIICPFCRREFEVAVEFDKDIPHKQMEDKYRRVYDVELKHGTAQVRMVTGADQVEAFGTGDRTIPEINTVILSRCIESINGARVADGNVALRMGTADRQKIVDLLVETQPGPQLQDIKVPCNWCSEEVATPMQLWDIFRF